MDVPVAYITVDAGWLANRHEAGVVTAYNIMIRDATIDPESILPSLQSIGFRYMLSIGAQVDLSGINDSCLPKMYILASLSACYQLSGFVLGVEETQDGSYEAKADIIRKYFAGQGTVVTLVNISATKTSWTEGVLLVAGDGASEIPEHMDLPPVTPNNGTTLQPHYSTDRVLLSGLSAEQERNWMNDNAGLLTQVSIAASLAYEQAEKERWKARAALYLSFIPLSKKVVEKEYYELKEWYHGEYEVLPLWFKRVGHLVKAFMGKRTFTSLYRNDAKRLKTDRNK